MKSELSFVVLAASCLAGLAFSAAAPTAGQPIEIERTSHVDHRLILFDAHDRRYVLPDGAYVGPDGTGLVIREGRIAELRGCGEAPCRLTSHATRIVEGRLSIYAEVPVPDGRYRRPSPKEDEGEISFLLEDGELVELVDDSQLPKPATSEEPAAPDG